MSQDNNNNDNLVRLSKLMSERGICSRREADEYIERGLVYVNGERVQTLGLKVARNVNIELAEKAKDQQRNLVTVLLNKPIGYVSNLPEDGYEPAVVLLTNENFYSRSTQSSRGSQKGNEDLNDNEFEKSSMVAPRSLDNMAVCGRLDIDSQGLLVFTQDGRIAKHLISEDSEVEKEYIVRVRGHLSANQLKSLNFGLQLDNKPLKPAKVDWVNEDQLRFVLTEGKKRQVRRMCELVGLQVLGLKRVRIGQVKLGDLPEGQWRYLSPKEKF